MSGTISSEPGLTLAETFAACRQQSRSALVVYTTAGHPSPEEGLDVLLRLADAGADVLELGVPFSDPLADGPTIQRSSFSSIERGVDLAWTLDLLARFSAERATPVVVFSYLNPILDYGVDRFLADAHAGGARGVLITDLPAGADPEMERRITDSPLDLIRLAAPTTSDARVREIAAASAGFLYYVSRTGVTGARAELSGGLAGEVERLKAATSLPIAVGFGVSTPDQARAVALLADGVVVGSAVVDLLEREGIGAAEELVRRLAEAVRR